MSKIRQDDVFTLARTVYGEARGESMEGRCAVALVVVRRWKNRKHRGTLASVCRQPWQFSCWNDNDPNRRKLESVDVDNATFRECLSAALFAIDATDEVERATTGLADHYMTESLFKSDDAPGWVRGHEPVAKIGHHVFFNDIN